VGATNRFAGDGTTTSTLLIAELLSEGRKMLQAGANPREVKTGLQIGRDIGV
jgi:chaperonin GroEL (HSP60 family)